MTRAIDQFTVVTYHAARDLPKAVWDAFHLQPREANIVYSYAAKSAAEESPLGRNTWIVCSRNDTSPPTVEFVLSCTDGPLREYPVFIFTTIPQDKQSPSILFPRVLLLVCALRAAVPTERVFSVFAPGTVSEGFAYLWSLFTGVDIIEAPYYAATFTSCTPHTLSKRVFSAPSAFVCEMHRAIESDIYEAAELCYAFAEDTPPFVLSRESATIEATQLVRKRQLWVHRMQRRDGTGSSEIASIIGVSRETAEVSAITKVYTSPRWRGKGCAARLLQHVCKSLLLEKKSVVLYVAHGNKPAACVYDRVGFAGLREGAPTEGVSDWLEIGFDRRLVRLGHW